MATALAIIQWDNYAGTINAPGIFQRPPLRFYSRQERLLTLRAGDHLWLVSRCPEDRQYYFVAVFRVFATRPDDSDSPEAREFGPYSVLADESFSRDLGKSFPAEGLLRAFTFENGEPIKYGANLGQSLQTIRFIAEGDSQILTTCLRRVQSGESRAVDEPFGLWTKCNRVFADYFAANWRARQEPLAFMLYDPPPVLRSGMPVFIHSDKNLRLLARFKESRFVAGHKFTASAEERIEEREAFWYRYRAPTINPPSKAGFDKFWETQNGVRAYFLIDELFEVPDPPQFKTYGKSLEWGYPTGVGYRYLSLSQSMLLFRQCRPPKEIEECYIKLLRP